MNFKTKALIIKSREFSETDKIFTAINYQGSKIFFLAKGVRRLQSKFSGHLNLFNYVNLILAKGKNLDIATSAEIIENFKTLEDNLKKIGIAFLIAESLDKLIQENENHPSVLFLALACFKWIEQNNPENISKIMPFFLINLADKIGILPELGKCVLCQRKNIDKKIWFDFHNGGIICQKCIKQKNIGKKISIQELNLLKYFLKLGRSPIKIKRLDIFKKIPDNLNKTTTDTILKFIEYNTDKKFLSNSFLKKIDNVI